MTTEDSLSRPAFAEGLLAMTGPSAKSDPECLPVRGDLAHIKLAGICFVPHYAVPMPYKALEGANLLGASHGEAEVLCLIEAGAIFNVLDIAGAWAWGQIGEEGRVGYVALDRIEQA